MTSNNIFGYNYKVVSTRKDDITNSNLPISFIEYSDNRSQIILYDPAMNYNPSTETLSCANITASTVFNGNLNGKITVLDGSLLTGNQPLIFTADSPGSKEHMIYDSGLYFNPSTDTLTMQNAVANVDILAKGNLGTLNNLEVGGTGEISSSLEVGGTLEVAGAVTMTSTSAVQIPAGTTAQRPSGVNGMMRYNSTTGEYEVYKGGAWENIVKSPIFEYAQAQAPQFFTLTTGNATQITPLTVTITPKSTSAKVHINVSMFGEFGLEGLLFNHMVFFKRIVGATTTDLKNTSTGGAIAEGINCLTRTFAGVDNNSTPEAGSFSYVDEPNTTSAATYQVWMFANGNADFCLNRTYGGTIALAYEYGMSTMTATCYH